MNWKQSLDRYLTNPPDDGYDDWCDTAVEKFTDQFFYPNEDWVFSSECDNWLWKLFRRGKSPEQAAAIIERAFKIYKTK